MSDSKEDIRKLRILVAIASYGNKQLDYLKQVIAKYKAMSMLVDVVVLSNIPKDLGNDVRVVVGLPIEDPWSLTFAHKPVLAENVDKYDLFLYSEDDMLVTEEHLEAFMRVTRALPEDEIAGHLRYELNLAGKKWMSDIHGHFHWKPDSVRVRQGYVFAEFTNEHAGFFMLTQNQLRRAIKSGGFLRAPYAGRYNMPEAAATDPFTSCGFRKVICISEIENFLLHHMSNRYIGRHGIPQEVFYQQVRALMDIQKGTHPASSLADLATKMPRLWWSKDYYERPVEELMKLVPETAKSILSVGCGWGETEVLLKQRGTSVTGLPLDSVIGAVAAHRGIEVIYGRLEEGLKQLKGRKFDCVLMTDMLHLLPEQERVLEACFELLQKGGALVISGPNFARISTVIKRLTAKEEYEKLESFEQSGVKMCGSRKVMKYARKAGLRVTAVKWINHAPAKRKLAGLEPKLGGITAKDWIVQAVS